MSDGRRLPALRLVADRLHAARAEGELPEVGHALEDEDGRALVVTKIGASPLPGRHRRCAFSVGNARRQRRVSAAARPSTSACASPLA